MLTVKYIDRDGSETVFAAETIQFLPNKPRADQPGPLEAEHPPGVLATLKSGAYVHYDRTTTRSIHDEVRKVYVMNEAGKTVATYEL